MHGYKVLQNFLCTDHLRVDEISSRVFCRAVLLVVLGVARLAFLASELPRKTELARLVG